MIYIVSNQQQLYNDFEAIGYSDVNFCIQYFKDKKYIGCDTETEGFSPYLKRLLLVQLGDEENQFVIDETVDIRLFKDFFEDKSKVFIFHNAKFDLRFFLHKRIIIKNVYDTYLAEKLLYLGYPPGIYRLGLADCTERYLGFKLDKSVRGVIHREQNSLRVITYAANDVKSLIPIMNLQEEALKNKGLSVAAKIEFQFVVVLAYVEYCGIHLDTSKWKEKMRKDNLLFDEYKKALDNWVVKHGDKKFINNILQGDLFLGFPEVSCSINWASSKQVVPFLESLGFNLEIKDRVTGETKKSVEAPIIERQSHISDIARLYLDYKQAEKIITTYGETFLKQINPVSGRIHTQFNQLMDTTRLSSGGKDKDTSTATINLQNIPSDKETRACFTAANNCVLIDCDYTAQEDLVFTELSQESKLIEFYNSPDKRDGHSFVAKMCFPIELKDIPEKEVKGLRPDLRQNAKGCKFCFHYGGFPATAARNLNISIEIAQNVYDNYFEAFPGINNYFKAVKKKSWESGYILINEKTGHKCFIHDWEELKNKERSFTKEFWDLYRKEKTDNTEQFKQVLYPIVSSYFKRKGDIDRMSLNYPVQGSSAIITKIAGIKLFDYLCTHNLLFTVLIPNLVHDEILVECPKELQDEISKVTQESMEGAGKIFCKAVTLKAVPEVATYWKH